MIDPVLTYVRRERFFEKINFNTPGGCWEWMGGLNMHGYGSYTAHVPPSHNRKVTLKAHRISFAIFRGEPGQSPLDHICRRRSCVNPYHLRRATARQNTVDWCETSSSAINARKTLCTNGHPFDAISNSKDRRRRCLTCERESGRRYREKKRVG